MRESLSQGLENILCTHLVEGRLNYFAFAQDPQNKKIVKIEKGSTLPRTAKIRTGFPTWIFALQPFFHTESLNSGRILIVQKNIVIFCQFVLLAVLNGSQS